jgi:MFS family permease
MTSRYRELLATPGAKGFAAAGFVMRLPTAMLTLGIVLLLSATTGAYAVAGAVAATFLLVQAMVSPFVARLVDRHGQAQVMLPAVGVHLAGMSALLFAAAARAPTWVLFLSAAVAAAAFLPMAALVRARWAHLVGGRGLLHAAYSFEAVADELIFIVGPVVVTLLATEVAPSAGLVVALGCAVAGTLALALQRHTQPPPSPPSRRGMGPSALRMPGLWVLTMAFVGFGGVLGSADVVVVAFTRERGQPAAAAFVLALIATGSMLAGIVYGAIDWRSRLEQRFCATVAALGLAVAMLPLVTRVPVLAVAVFLAGIAISPSLISGFGLVEALVPAVILTEGLTWTTTGIGVGMAAGSVLAGPVIDAHGARSAFIVTACAGLVATVVVLAGRRWLRVPMATAAAIRQEPV